MVLTVIGSDRKANFSGNQRCATRNILMTLSQNSCPSVRTWAPAFDTAQKGVTYDSLLNLTTLRCAQVNVAMVLKSIFGVKLNQGWSIASSHRRGKTGQVQSAPLCSSCRRSQLGILLKRKDLSISNDSEYFKWTGILAWAMTYVLINRQEIST